MKHDFDIIHNSRPVLRFCEQFDDTNPLWNHSRHSHPYIELLFFLDGKANEANICFFHLCTLAFPL